MEEALGAHEVRGASERHHIVLPSFPNYKVGGQGSRGWEPCIDGMGAGVGGRVQHPRIGRWGWAKSVPGTHLHSQIQSPSACLRASLPTLCLRALPACLPRLQELTEADAEKLAALLEARLGKRFEDIGLEDMTAEVTQEVGGWALLCLFY